MPIKPGQKEHVIGTIEEQTRQTLANLDAILKALGSGPDQVLRVTVYVSDVSHWAKVDGVYAEFFGEHRPARTLVPVGKLHYWYEIELDAMAVAG